MDLNINHGSGKGYTIYGGPKLAIVTPNLTIWANPARRSCMEYLMRSDDEIEAMEA
jgi:hypothetical protein